MGIRRFGHADRRRRWLVDEVLGQQAGRAGPGVDSHPLEDSSARTPATKATPPRLAACMEAQLRVTDLIPRSFATIALFFMSGLTIVAGLETLYSYMPELGRNARDGRVAAFDLDGEGSLAVWFSSATLAAAALVAWVVFSVRRHKADDYHGRYRVWAWAGACWLTMSIDECASLHEGFKELMTVATGQRLFGDGSIWWVGAYLPVLGWIGARLLMEMKVCKGSTTAMFATAGCYAAAVCAQLGLVWPESGAKGVMLEEGCEMAGNLCLLLAMGLHARYAIFEAEGLLPEKVERKPKETAVEHPKPAAVAKKQADAEPRRSWFSRFGRKAKIDPAHGSPPHPSRRSDLDPVRKPALAAAVRPSQPAVDAPSVRPGQPVQPAPPDEDDQESNSRQRLSKAERKALRRQQRERYSDED